MALSTQINQMLAPMGLKLQRVPGPLELSQTPMSNAGHQVEMIGPSGVGKSYFFGKLSTRMTADWLTKSQIRKYGPHEKDFFKELEGKDPTLEEYLLQEKRKSIWNQDIPLWRKHRLYRFYVATLANDAFGRERCLPVQGIFMDDGVQHNYSVELLDWHILHASHSADDRQRLEAFMRGRSLILMDAPIEHTIRNLARRHSQMRGATQNDWLAWMPEAEVLIKITERRETNQRLIKLAASLGAPVLEIDASEDVSINKGKLLDFLESIQQERSVY